jgi:salicylate 5-hydroxylase small subunit
MMDFKTYFELTQLYADYAAAVDNAEWQKWADMFTEACEYKVQPRENHERGFPLCTMSFISKNMLRDRIYGIRETLFHDPYYQRHVTGQPLVRQFDGACIVSEANYAVFRTKLSQETTVFNAGRYLDRIRIGPEGMKFESRICVYDSEMIPNSMIYPI